MLWVFIKIVIDSLHSSEGACPSQDCGNIHNVPEAVPFPTMIARLSVLIHFNKTGEECQEALPQLFLLLFFSHAMG